ncbi:MAG: M12 family metallo-peptidase, partial [Candidatus Rokubacteria bacterium]|nr:M12 family metallo-peptidase [Candidatus Rokubacteria bacterium]
MHSAALLPGRIAAVLSALSLCIAAQSASVRPAPPELLLELGLADATLQEIEVPEQPGATFSFPLWIEGAWREVTAWPYSVRAPGYRLVAMDEGGAREEPPAPETTYRGEVAGAPGSRVALTLFEGRVQGVVRLAAGEPWHGFQPAPDAGRELVVYSEESVLATGAVCGGALPARPGSAPALPAADGGGGKICELAVDADFEFFQSNGSSVAATENDITGIINAVEAIYEDAADVVYDVTVIYVETAEPDPYSSTSAGTLLDQFQNHWNASHQADPRDVAHLFTGKNLSGSTIGIAYLNVICNKSSAYGLSQSKFSFSFTLRVGLTAHELGHNWSASHCDGDFDCKIMCSSIGGCGPVTSFGSSATASINAKKASSGCLEDLPPPAPPVLTGLQPGTVQAFAGGPLDLQGQFLDEVTAVHVGGTTLLEPFGFTVESETAILLQAPTPADLGPVSVTAENGAGTSNPLTLTYVETSPPKLGAPGFGLTGALFSWTFGAGADDAWFLIVSVGDPATVPFGGFQVLSNGFLVASGGLSPAGVGSHGL